MSMKTLAVALMLLLPAWSFAGTRLVETTATGVGRDDNEALADALANAVAQVNGTQSSLSVHTGSAVLEGQAKSVKDGKVETLDASVTARNTPDVHMKAAGSVASYEKIGSKTRGDGKIEVTVKAKVEQSYKEVYHYNVSGSAAGRKRIAVLRPNSDAVSYDFFGPSSSDDICDQLWTAIESGALQSGSVSVLDRKTLGESLDELNLVASDLTNAQEKAKLKLIRGADLIVMPTLHRAEHAVVTQVNPMSGVASRYDNTLLDVEVRAVVSATGEILMDKHYVLRSAMDREAAFQQVASDAGQDIAAVVQGRAPSASGHAAPPPAVVPVYAPAPAPQPQQPFKLPGDH